MTATDFVIGMSQNITVNIVLDKTIKFIFIKPIKEVGDGRYEALFTATRCGYYTISITVDGLQIPGSPCKYRIVFDILHMNNVEMHVHMYIHSYTYNRLEVFVKIIHDQYFLFSWMIKIFALGQCCPVSCLGSSTYVCILVVYVFVCT